jgi:TPR repeat protein
LDFKLLTQIKEGIFLCTKKNADLGDAKAQYLVAKFYKEGIGTKKSYEKQATYLKLSADQGYEEAACELGQGYDYAFWNLPQSYEDAYYYYKIAASKGYNYCNYLLGYFSEYGLGTKQSYEKAFEYYKKAFEGHCGLYAGYIGNLYEQGYGVPKSSHNAKIYYGLMLEHSLEENSLPEKEKTGLSYLKEGNEEKGRRYLLEVFIHCKAKAFQDDVKAHKKLSQFYLNGYGIKQSFELAEYHMKRAHEIQEEEFQLLDSSDTEDARTLAVWDLQKLADDGDASAQYRLALCYAHGQGVERSLELYSYYLQVAAKNGCAEAQSNLGHSYEFANSPFPCDLEKAVYWYKLAAHQGDLGALYLLGYFYQHGVVVEKSIETALEYYEKGASEGECTASGILAYCYEFGIGLPESIEQAKQIYRIIQPHMNWDENTYFDHKYLGARTGNTFAEQHAYFLCFIYCRAKAEAGDAQAQCEIGNFYRKGWGVNKSYKEAANYYQLASKHEYPEALRWMGYFFEHGIHFAQTDEKAISFYQKAASYNDGPALVSLGQMLKKDKLVELNKTPLDYYRLGLNGVWNVKEVGKDNVELLLYLTAKAELGDATAWFDMARNLRFDRNIQFSEYTFENCLKRAADLGCSRAAFSLGNIYDFQKRDYSLAMQYYQKASQAGHSTATAYLGHFYEFGLGVPQSIEKALEYYKLAAKTDNPCALRSLAYCYEHGKGVPISHELAKEYNSRSYRLCNIHEEWTSNIGKHIPVRTLFANNDKDLNYYLYLGDYCLRGVDVLRNDERALEAYEKAAKLGSEEALHMLFYFNKRAA